MGVIVTPLHWYHTPSHLTHVIAEMRRRGPPRIRAHHHDGVWYAKEGTHRLRAVLALGLAPILVPVPWWRTRAALERASYAAIRHGHVFDVVTIAAPSPERRYAPRVTPYAALVAALALRALAAIDALVPCPVPKSSAPADVMTCPAHHARAALAIAVAASSDRDPDDALARLVGAGAHETRFVTERQRGGPAVCYYQVEVPRAQRLALLQDPVGCALLALQRARLCHGSMRAYATGSCAVGAHGPRGERAAASLRAWVARARRALAGGEGRGTLAAWPTPAPFPGPRPRSPSARPRIGSRPGSPRSRPGSPTSGPRRNAPGARPSTGAP